MKFREGLFSGATSMLVSDRVTCQKFFLRSPKSKAFSGVWLNILVCQGVNPCGALSNPIRWTMGDRKKPVLKRPHRIGLERAKYSMYHSQTAYNFTTPSWLHQRLVNLTWSWQPQVSFQSYGIMSGKYHFRPTFRNYLVRVIFLYIIWSYPLVNDHIAGWKMFHVP